MDFGNIVSRGWQITWKNKYLWVLGFLAAFGRGASANFNYSTNNPEELNQLMETLPVILSVMCFAMLVGVLFWLLSLVAKGGLITAVSRSEQGETMTLGQAFQAGTSKIWSLVGLNLLLYLPLMLIGLVFAGIIVFFVLSAVGTASAFETNPELAMDAIGQQLAAGATLFLLCLCMLMCVMVVFGLFIQFINAFAYRGIMLRNLGVMEAISHGWQVFRQNLAEVLLLSLLFLVIGMVFGFAIGMVMLPMSLVVMAPMFAMGSGDGLGMLGGLWLMGGAFCLGLVGAALYSVLITWQSATFTLAYEEWTGKEKTAVEFQ